MAEGHALVSKDPTSFFWGQPEYRVMKKKVMSSKAKGSETPVVFQHGEDSAVPYE